MAELTALELNNKIVKMRPVIGQVKCIVNRKLIQKMKSFKAKKGTDEQKQKNLKKVERFHQEIQAAKKLKPDEVSKFALLNTKSFPEFEVLNDTPAEKRILYKIVTHKILQDNVDDFRSKYPKWHQEIPFHLQRLGRQYQNKEKKESRGQSTRVSGHNESTKKDDEDNKESDEGESDAEMGESISPAPLEPTEEKVTVTSAPPAKKEILTPVAPKRARTVVMPKTGQNGSNCRMPKLPVVPEIKRIPVVANTKRGAAVIKKIDLASDNWLGESEAQSQVQSELPRPNASTKDKFFAAPGGTAEGSDEEDAGGDSWDEAADNNDLLVKESLKLRKERDSLREGVGKKMRSHYCASLKHPVPVEPLPNTTSDRGVRHPYRQQDRSGDHHFEGPKRPEFGQGKRVERPRDQPQKWKPPAADVHPSWEAKRKLKEKEGLVASKGKKKIFKDQD